MTCYLFGAGCYPEQIPMPDVTDLVIAVDGGLTVCHRLGLSPQLAVGDFDSLGRRPNEGEVVALPVHKDDTDMAVALEEGVKRGATRFVLLGGDGGRPDHTYANYLLLARAAARGHTAYMVGQTYASAVLCGSSLTIPRGGEGTLSLFAIGGEASGVTLDGVEYPLGDATLSPLDPLGVSNRIVGEGARVSVRQGKVLLLWEMGEKFVFPS